MAEHGSCEIAVFLSNKARQDAIVTNVVIARILVVRDLYPPEPLNTSAAYVDRNHQSDGISVVWR